MSPEHGPAIISQMKSVETRASALISLARPNADIPGYDFDATYAHCRRLIQLAELESSELIILCSDFKNDIRLPAVDYEEPDTRILVFSDQLSKLLIDVRDLHDIAIRDRDPAKDIPSVAIAPAEHAEPLRRLEEQMAIVLQEISVLQEAQKELKVDVNKGKVSFGAWGVSADTAYIRELYARLSDLIHRAETFSSELFYSLLNRARRAARHVRDYVEGHLFTFELAAIEASQKMYLAATQGLSLGMSVIRRAFKSNTGSINLRTAQDGLERLFESTQREIPTFLWQLDRYPPIITMSDDNLVIERAGNRRHFMLGSEMGSAFREMGPAARNLFVNRLLQEIPFDSSVLDSLEASREVRRLPWEKSAFRADFPFGMLHNAISDEYSLVLPIGESDFHISDRPSTNEMRVRISKFLYDQLHSIPITQAGKHLAAFGRWQLWKKSTTPAAD